MKEKTDGTLTNSNVASQLAGTESYLLCLQAGIITIAKLAITMSIQDVHLSDH